MKLKGDLWQRLRVAINPERFSLAFAPKAIVLTEKKAKGRAEILLAPGIGMLCIAWDIEANIFGFLGDEKNADGAFFVLGNGDDVEAHIVECKRTINTGVWRKSKKQMRATLLRLRALAGVLGLTITRVVCYLAFHKDEEGDITSADPAVFRLPIGACATATTEDQETLAILREQYGWREDAIELPDITGLHTHRRLKLHRRDPLLRLDDDVCVGSFQIEAT